MSFQRTAALASLTATYTDSESEGDDHISNKDDDDEDDEERSQNAEESEAKTMKNLLVSDERFADSRGNSPANTFSIESLAKKSENVIEDFDFESNDLVRPTSPISFHKSLLGLKEAVIPAEPIEKCSRSLQDKITRLHEKMKQGYDMNAMIQRRKDFRNPSIYEKLISYCGIDEMDTNYPHDIYDPHKFGPESYYEELAKRQKEEMEKKEKERKQRTKVEFISGTVKRGNAQAETAGNKKKSKWDIPVGLQASTLSTQKKS